MENFATDRLFPTWRCWDQFVYSDVNSALSLDALLSSHPIEVDVERAEDVDEIFDAISYSKGSVVVRLLEDFLGIDTFTRGIQAYIQRFQYRNATTEDLWAELQAVSSKPVKEMMERWTRHVGFPLLTLSEPREEDGAIVFDVRQQRFLVTGVKEDDDTLWFVPVSFLVSGQQQPMSKQILKERQGQLRLEGAGKLADIHWIKINPNQTVRHSRQQLLLRHTAGSSRAHAHCLCHSIVRGRTACSIRPRCSRTSARPSRRRSTGVA